MYYVSIGYSKCRAWVSAWAQRPLTGFAHRVLGDWEISEIVCTPLYTVAYVDFSERISLGFYQCLWYQIRRVTTGLESFIEGYENLKWNFKRKMQDLALFLKSSEKKSEILYHGIETTILLKAGAWSLYHFIFLAHIGWHPKRFCHLMPLKSSPVKI